MVSIDKIAEKVKSIINQYGNDIFIISVGVTSKDEYGVISRGETEISAKGVFDQSYVSKMRLFSSGKLGAGESYILITGDNTITKDDLIRKGTTRYKILEIETYGVANVDIVYNVRVIEQ